MKKKTIYLIVIILFIVAILSIGTYALLLWRSGENTELTLRIGDFADVVFSKGNDINVNDIGPVFDYEKDGEKTTFSVSNLTTDIIEVNVSLNITTISDNLKEESFKYVLLSSKDGTNYKKIAEGNFANSTNNSVINLVTGDKVLNNMNYKLIIYIDGNAINSITMQNGSLTGFIEVTADGIILVTDEYMAANTEVTTTEVDINYTYTEPEMTELTLNPGIYKLEAWGAQGGSMDSDELDALGRYPIGYSEGGRGGYSYGTLNLSQATTVYVYVGGQAVSDYYATAVSYDCHLIEGGFNGGGGGANTCLNSSKWQMCGYGQGGGGASDIRIGTDSLYARVIVAGGGSGGTQEEYGYYGGGLVGGIGEEFYISAANQTSADGSGQFGIGGSCLTGNEGPGCSGGGGGWYGGSDGDNCNDDGCDGNIYGAGSGGSGYVYTSSTAVNYPSGCLLNSSYYLTNAETIAGDQSFPTVDGTGTETGHNGDGAVKITGTETVYTYSFPRLLGLTDLTLSVGTSVSLTDNVTIECETGGTSCNLVGPEITDTSTLSVGTHTIYYIATDSNGKKYKYERTIIVS